MTFFLQAFVTLFVIIDPPGIVPVFLGLTRGRSARARRKLAWQAAVVAFSVIIAFALFGRAILNYTQVGLPALEGAGGLLLLLVSLQLLTGQTEEPTSAERAKANVAFVPLGTPLLAGPGAIVATMLYVQRVHSVLNGVALALAICAVAVAAWLSMRFAEVIHRVLTDNGVELLTRIAACCCRRSRSSSSPSPRWLSPPRPGNRARLSGAGLKWRAWKRGSSDRATARPGLSATTTR